MYLESIKDGRRFLRLSRRAIKEKPIIIFKGAVTESGARVSATHTASVAGEDRIYDAAFRQSGIIRVADFDQLFNVTKAFVQSPLPKGNRVAIINVTGAGCVIAADACVRSGLKIAELSGETIARAETVYPDWWHARNPIDIWTAIEASGFENAYDTLTRAALGDEGVDAIVVIMGAIDWVPVKAVTRIFKNSFYCMMECFLHTEFTRGYFVIPCSTFLNKFYCLYTILSKKFPLFNKNIFCTHG